MWTQIEGILPTSVVVKKSRTKAGLDARRDEGSVIIGRRNRMDSDAHGVLRGRAASRQAGCVVSQYYVPISLQKPGLAAWQRAPFCSPKQPGARVRTLLCVVSATGASTVTPPGLADGQSEGTALATMDPICAPNDCAASAARAVLLLGSSSSVTVADVRYCVGRGSLMADALRANGPAGSDSAITMYA